MSSTDYQVILSSNDPVIQGAQVSFTAILLTTDGSHPEGKFEYQWRDNAIFPHTREVRFGSNIVYILTVL